MKFRKRVVGKLNKCYSIAEMNIGGEQYFAVAAEKQDPCYLFSAEGELVDKLWDGPGGTMTIEQLPGTAEKPVLLAVNRFYSPDESTEASIAYYTKEEGGWRRELLCDLPFVHRFGILSRDGKNYLVACTLKSAHAFDGDWTCPGRIWTAELPADLSCFNAENQLKLTPLKSGLYHNHGFCKSFEDAYSFAVVGCDQGIFKVTPPAAGGEWSCELLLDSEASDMLYEDLDSDGERELLVLSPFHGDSVTVYKRGRDGAFGKVFALEKKMPFLHAICCAKAGGKSFAVIGDREGEKELAAIVYDGAAGTYRVEVLDRGAGPANAMFFEHGGRQEIVAANRETDEIAVYGIEG